MTERRLPSFVPQSDDSHAGRGPPRTFGHGARFLRGNDGVFACASLVRLLLYFEVAAESRPRKDTMLTLTRSCFLAAPLVVLFSALCLTGCATAALSPQGAQVAVTRNPPTPDCITAGYLVGEGGGTFGGKWISNDSLLEYALNDLRNKAAKLGANYVQTDPPQLGSGHGTTSTATITGTAYRCTATL